MKIGIWVLHNGNPNWGNRHTASGVVCNTNSVGIYPTMTSISDYIDYKTEFAKGLSLSFNYTCGNWRSKWGIILGTAGLATEFPGAIYIKMTGIKPMHAYLRYMNQYNQGDGAIIRLYQWSAAGAAIDAGRYQLDAYGQPYGVDIPSDMVFAPNTAINGSLTIESIQPEYKVSQSGSGLIDNSLSFTTGKKIARTKPLSKYFDRPGKTMSPKKSSKKTYRRT